MVQDYIGLDSDCSGLYAHESVSLICGGGLLKSVADSPVVEPSSTLATCGVSCAQRYQWTNEGLLWCNVLHHYYLPELKADMFALVNTADINLPNDSSGAISSSLKHVVVRPPSSFFPGSDATTNLYFKLFVFLWKPARETMDVGQISTKWTPRLTSINGVSDQVQL